MKGFWQRRSKWNLAALIIGTSLLMNLVQIVQKINGHFILLPYMVTMTLALVVSALGFFKKNSQYIGYGSGFWLFSLALNVNSFLFVIPIFIMNHLGKIKIEKDNSKLEMDLQ